MPQLTPPGSPYPELSDEANVPADLLKTAGRIDRVSLPLFATTGQRDTAFPTTGPNAVTVGQFCRVIESSRVRIWEYTAGGWVSWDRYPGVAQAGGALVGATPDQFACRVSVVNSTGNTNAAGNFAVLTGFTIGITAAVAIHAEVGLTVPGEIVLDRANSLPARAEFRVYRRDTGAIYVGAYRASVLMVGA